MQDDVDKIKINKVYPPGNKQSVIIQYAPVLKIEPGQEPPVECWSELTAGRWIVAYRLMPAHETREPVIGEIRIFPAEPDRPHAGRWSAETLGIKARAPRRGITTDILKTVRIGQRTAFFRELLAEFTRLQANPGIPPIGFAKPVLAAFRAPEAPPIAPRSGVRAGRRRTVSDTQLAMMARDYIEALARKDGHAARTIKKRYRLKTEAQVRMRVLRAGKERGLVARSRDDRALLVLTPAAETILADIDRGQTDCNGLQRIRPVASRGVSRTSRRT